MSNSIHFFGSITKDNLNDFGLNVKEKDTNGYENVWILETENHNEMFGIFNDCGYLEYVCCKGQTYGNALKDILEKHKIAVVSDYFPFELFFISETDDEETRKLKTRYFELLVKKTYEMFDVGKMSKEEENEEKEIFELLTKKDNKEEKEEIKTENSTNVNAYDTLEDLLDDL